MSEKNPHHPEKKKPNPLKWLAIGAIALLGIDILSNGK
jgi:hypothetical protein